MVWGQLLCDEFRKRCDLEGSDGRDDYVTLLHLERYAGPRIHECFCIDTAMVEDAVKNHTITIKGKGSRKKRVAGKGTLRSNIKTHIQKQIAGGVCHPGNRIVETQLTKDPNVSRAPVRKAILELPSIGLLEVCPYSGTFVCGLSAGEIEGIFNTWVFVEKYGAHRVAKRISDQQLRELEEILCQLDANQDFDPFVQLNMEFHGPALEAAARPALKRA